MVAILDDGLKELRRQINLVDNQLLTLIEARFELVKGVIDGKVEAGLPVRDLEREEEIILSKIQRSGLPEDVVRNVFRLLMDESVKMQENEGVIRE